MPLGFSEGSSTRSPIQTPRGLALVWPLAPSDFRSKLTNLVVGFFPHIGIPPLHQSLDAVFLYVQQRLK